MEGSLDDGPNIYGRVQYIFAQIDSRDQNH